MLINRILGKKKIIEKLGNQMTDLISSTFKFPSRARESAGAILVNEFEQMRPDLIANRIYGTTALWDVLLKYNGVSNPFSVNTGDILLGPSSAFLESTYVNPVNILDRNQKAEGTFSPILDPLGKKDKDRLDNLKKKAGVILPPNVNKPGDKNVKIKDGRVIFGEDVTGINKKNCPVPISRTRLQAALLKDKLSI